MKRLLRKHLFLVLMAYLVLGCSGMRQAEAPDPVEPTYSLEEVAEKASDYTVAMMLTPEDDVSRPYCTGVWVSQTEILTAAHCIMSYAESINNSLDENSIQFDPYELTYNYIVKLENQGLGRNPLTMHGSKLVKMDFVHDLALVKVFGEVPVHTYAEIAESVPGLGSHIVIVGHPKGIYWSCIEGTISNVHKNLPLLKLGPWIQINGTVYFGNSGGGAFDKHGKLIGIASFMPPVPNMAMYVHRDSISKFLGR